MDFPASAEAMPKNQALRAPLNPVLLQPPSFRRQLRIIGFCSADVAPLSDSPMNRLPFLSSRPVIVNPARFVFQRTVIVLPPPAFK